MKLIFKLTLLLFQTLFLVCCESKPAFTEGNSEAPISTRNLADSLYDEFKAACLNKSEISSALLLKNTKLDSIYLGPNSFARGDSVFLLSNNRLIAIISINDGISCMRQFLLAFKQKANTDNLLGAIDCDRDGLEAYNFQNFTCEADSTIALNFYSIPKGQDFSAYLPAKTIKYYIDSTGHFLVR